MFTSKLSFPKFDSIQSVQKLQFVCNNFQLQRNIIQVQCPKYYVDDS